MPKERTELYRCHHCRNKIEVKKNSAGKKIKCDRCGRSIIIPVESANDSQRRKYAGSNPERYKKVLVTLMVLILAICFILYIYTEYLA
ncbi:MAG: hypothetical protein ACYTFY_15860 [Planctomycetota bacterium]|jgi:DNA-directed RNA polymerase subunit RPC12/RpoP